ncbi:MAG: ATP-binding protein [Candidatus Hydrogenedentes bacterium]|nr:ATP-binding protein [Candidatus Hydrogenedentota bacterium]
MGNTSGLDFLAKVQSGALSHRKIAASAMVIFVPGFAVILAVTTVVLFSTDKAEMRDRRREELHTVRLQAANIDRDILGASSDLAILAHGRAMEKLWDDTGELVPEAVADLSRDFQDLSRSRRLYDQVRLLDDTGMEIIRVNTINDLPVLVPSEKLQNKRDRHYFNEAFKLNSGEVFVSPLDLNVEDGKIEEPIKPMLRFATPVFDQSGRKRGIVLLNHFGIYMLDRFASQSSTLKSSQAMLLNAKGYWLKAPNPEDEWGFMYEDKKGRSFPAVYPDAWEQLKSEESCQFITPDGMFTAETVYPLLCSDMPPTDTSRTYYWKAVSFVPSKSLYAAQSNRRLTGALVLALLGIAWFLAAWRIAKAGLLRRRAEAELLKHQKDLEKLVEERTNTLKISEAKYQTFFENSGDAMLIIRDFQFVDCNAATVVMLGYKSKKELLNTHPSELSPEFQPDGENSYDKAMKIMEIAFAKGTHRFEWDHKRKNGEVFAVAVTLTAIPQSGKTVLHTVWRDISAQKRAEAERKNLEAQLRQSQKMEAVGQLAGGIAHDFNNILQAIMGYGDLALIETEADSPSREPIEEVLRAGKRAKTLISQLLAFSRRQVLEMKDVNLNYVIADLMNMTHRLIGDHITLDALAGNDLGIVRADRGQIEQILMNLCVNARDAMSDGGTITIETENAQFDESYCATHAWAGPGRFVLLRVSDTGCGMEEGILSNIFEPFFTTRAKGTGLGLASVAEFMAETTGAIRLESAPGRGTTLHLYFPVDDINTVDTAETIASVNPTKAVDPGRTDDPTGPV